MDPHAEPRSNVTRVVLTVLGILALLAAVCCGGTWLVGQRLKQTIAPAHEGSGTLAEQRRLVEGFTGVRLEAAADVEVEVGGAFSVTLRADDNLMPHIETAVDDGALVVRARERFESETGVVVLVTLPSLERVENAGVGAIRVKGVDSPRLVVRVAGVGDVAAAGRVGELTVDVSGVGDALLLDLVAERVTARVEGVGDASVHATRSLHATVAGVGDVRYRGDPAELVQQKSGVGDVVPVR